MVTCLEELTVEGTLPSSPHSVFRWSLFSKALACFLGYEAGKGKTQVWETEGVHFYKAGPAT